MRWNRKASISSRVDVLYVKGVAMIEKERFGQLWKLLVEETKADKEKAKASPLSIGNGVSNQLRKYLLDNIGNGGECIADRANGAWINTPRQG